MPNIVLITPGSGVQEIDANELNSTLEAVAAGGQLSPTQQAMANALQTPTQGNVFRSGTVDAATVKDVSKVAGAAKPVVPLPQTLTGGSAASKDIQGFLGSLKPSDSGQAIGKPGGRVNVNGTPLGGTFDVNQLQSLLFPQNTANDGGNARGGTVATFGDPADIERNENLRLAIDFQNLQNERANQVLREQVRQGIVPAAARVTNQLGKPIVDLKAIGLTPEEVDFSTNSSRKTFDDLFGRTPGSQRGGIIGQAPKLSQGFSNMFDRVNNSAGGFPLKERARAQFAAKRRLGF